MFFGDIDTCTDCTEEESKFREWKDFYQHGRGKEFSTRNSVLDVFFRGKFSLEQTAEILQMKVRDVKFEIDILRQDAR